MAADWLDFATGAVRMSGAIFSEPRARILKLLDATRVPIGTHRICDELKTRNGKPLGVVTADAFIQMLKVLNAIVHVRHFGRGLVKNPQFLKQTVVAIDPETGEHIVMRFPDSAFEALKVEAQRQGWQLDPEYVRCEIIARKFL